MPSGAEHTSVPDLPEDVAALYQWAKLEPIPYQDFSASRSIERAERRYNDARLRRDAAAVAKAQAERARDEAERALREAGEAARHHASQARRSAEQPLPERPLTEGSAHDRAQLRAGQISREMAGRRAEVARCAEALRSAELALQREREELAQAQATAARRTGGATASRETKAAFLTRDAASTPISEEPPLPEDREFAAERREAEGENFPRSAEEMQPTRFSQRRDPRMWLPVEGDPYGDEEQRVHGEPPPENSEGPVEYLHEPSAGETLDAVDQYARAMPYTFSANAIEAGEPGDLRELGPVAAADERDAVSDPASRGLSPADEPLPSWIVTPEHDKGDGSARSSVREALQHSRERFASRWYALRELFSPSSKRTEPEEPSPAPALPPLLAIFSLAGGVGKTTLAAAIARVLSAGGERVLLVDTTPHGILPFHFGARELRPGVGRTFTPPAGSPDQPIQLVSYPGMDGSGPAGANDAETFETRLRRDSTGFARVIVDVSAPSILDNLVQLGARVLVPVASTMNSVLGLPTVRDICADLRDRENKPVQPGFLLTHFDASQPLQLDIREVLQQHLGEGLLPFFVRRSPRVPEALAEGMTVIDFAPGETVTADYRQTAAWVRTLGEPARGDLRHARWSER